MPADTTTESAAIEQVAATDLASGPLEIPGNVDPSTGNVDAPHDVHVAGNVVDLHELLSRGSVTVDGVIEAATVTAARDLTAAGGIAGKQAGHVTAGASLAARYIRQAHVEAAADVSVQTEITNARVIAGNDLRTAGDIVGGHVTAAGSVSCQSAGSPAGTPTLLEIGTDESLRRVAEKLVPEINRNRAKATKIRHAVAPLMRNPKLLTPQQKEQATELLFDAETAEDSVNESLARLTTLYSRSIARTAPTLKVTGTLHAGVTLRCGAYETTLTASLPGPLGIRLKSSPGRHNFQLVSCADNSSTLLPATPVQDPIMDQLRKEMAQRV
jgi:uncharacterized protein (DUF342 family)